MTRWKKDETEFTVSLSHDGGLGMIARIPKPIREELGNPTKIKFLKYNGKILVDSGDD